MTSSDPERIPAFPTTDAEPPAATSVVTGPSQVPTSPAGGRGRRSWGRRAFVGLVLVATFTVGIGVGQYAPSIAAGESAAPTPTSAELGLFKEAWDDIHTQYVGRADLNDRDLIYGAISGLTTAVGDTGHTSFMTPDQRQARADSMSGSYVGIGVRVDATDAGLPKIVSVFPNSPAETAGLVAGDVVISVNGTSTTGKTLDAVSGEIRGEAGTTVVIAVKANGTGAERSYSITRADVELQPVSWTIVPGTHTAQLFLDQFSTGSSKAVITALTEIKAAGADALILDLRGNPGGYVNEAVAIASQFLKSGVVYIDRDASGNETPQNVTAGGIAQDIPMVVLVDANTASSSEIVTGALQDAGRAQVVGVTTYGTGTVLGEFALSDGSALRIGTVEWLTPKGRQIWHNGITPDVVVERPSDVQPLYPDAVRALTVSQVSSIKDPQLAKAIELSRTRLGQTPQPSGSPQGSSQTP
jgi:carboxyl-terminal processing protease